MYQHVWGKPVHRSVPCVQLKAAHGRYFFAPFGSNVKAGILACQNDKHMSCIVRIEWGGGEYTLTHSWANLAHDHGRSSERAQYTKALDGMMEDVNALADAIISSAKHVDVNSHKQQLQTIILRLGIKSNNLKSQKNEPKEHISTQVRLYRAMIEIASTIRKVALSGRLKGRVATVGQINALWNHIRDKNIQRADYGFMKLVREAIINIAVMNARKYDRQHKADMKQKKSNAKEDKAKDAARKEAEAAREAAKAVKKPATEKKNKKKVEQQGSDSPVHTGGYNHLFEDA
jgi:hypothetical protein